MSASTVVAGGAVVFGSLVVAGLSIRHRRSPGALPIASVAVLIAAMATGLGLSSVSGSQISALSLYVRIWPAVTVAWFAFALSYTGRGPALTNRFGLALVAFVIASQLVLAGVQPEFAGVGEVAQSVLTVTLFSAGVVGTLLIASALGRRYGGPRRLTAALVAAGLALVSLVVPPTLFSSMVGLVRWVWLGQLGGMTAALLVAAHAGIFSGPPSTGHFARTALLDQMPDAVLVVDPDDRVLDINTAAAKTFGVSRAAVFGTTVETVLGSALPSDPDGTPATRTLKTVDGDRQFELSVTELSADAADVYLLRDITERYTDERRLAALNRVLRHNLRNDLDAIRGFAERLGEPGAEPAPLADRIRALATDLSDTGAIVAETERLFAQAGGSVEPINLPVFLEDVAEAAEGDADGTVTVDVYAPTSVVRTDPAILRPVVRELVANALTHTTDGDTPVEVTVTDAPDGVNVVVTDRGPGLPEREQAVLLDGDESPLRHGSGLGLWLVHIGATQLGGELTYRSREPRGAAINLRVPDHGAAMDEVS